MHSVTALVEHFVLQAQELLINIASLESTVSELEKELNDLYYQLCHERNERLLAENNQGCLPSKSSDDHQSLSTCTCTWEEVSIIWVDISVCLLCGMGVIDSLLITDLSTYHR